MIVHRAAHPRVFLRSTLIAPIPSIVHGFGVRGVGIDAWLTTLGLGGMSLPKTSQVHGKEVHRLGKEMTTPTWRTKARGQVLKGDAFITDCPGIVCFVRTADCVPILIADVRGDVVAAVHAGWRGTSLDVVGEAIRAMGREFGTSPLDCAVAIGPHICGNCYEVGRDVMGAIATQELDDIWIVDGHRVDLGIANKLLIERAGVPPARISILPHCTSCDSSFASWRRDHNPRERQFNFIVITPRRSNADRQRGSNADQDRR